MAKRRSNDLARARAEAAALLRLDPSHLSPADVLRCDIVASLRLVIDSAHADVLDGTQTDLGKLLVAVETLTKLLPAVDVKMGTTTVSAATARAKLLQLVLDARAADKFEDDQADRSDLQAALARVAALEDEVLHLRGVRPRRLPPPTDKPLRSVDRSATEPTKPASTTKLAVDPGPPPGYDPIVSGLWRPPVAAPAAPVASSPPPSTPPPARPSEPAWRAWYYNGGGAGNGMFGPTPWSDDSPAQGWIDRLNGKAY
jgi:hypothetical protein